LSDVLQCMNKTNIRRTWKLVDAVEVRPPWNIFMLNLIDLAVLLNVSWLCGRFVVCRWLLQLFCRPVNRIMSLLRARVERSPSTPESDCLKTCANEVKTHVFCSDIPHCKLPVCSGLHRLFCTVLRIMKLLAFVFFFAFFCLFFYYLPIAQWGYVLIAVHLSVSAKCRKNFWTDSGYISRKNAYVL